MLLSIPPGYATPVWPAAGFAFVCILVFGYDVWIGIFLGSILANFSNTFDPTDIVTIVHSSRLLLWIGCGSALEAVVGAYLVRRFVGYPNALLYEKDLLMFLGLAGPASCLISSTVGVTGLLFEGKILLNQVAISWSTWWVGDSIGVMVFAPMLMIWVGQPREQWRQKWRSTFLPLCMMFLLVLFIFINARKWEQKQKQTAFIQQTEQLNEVLTKNFERYLETIYSLRAFYQSSNAVDRAEFKIFTSQLLERHPGIKTMSWNAFVKENELSKFINDTKKEGFPDFSIRKLDRDRILTPIEMKGDHIVLTFQEPFNLNPKVMGFDLSSSLERYEALIKAARTGEASTTGKVLLVQVPGRKQGVIVYIPVYKTKDIPPTEKLRMENLTGFVAGGFEIQQMMDGALKNIRLGNVRLRIVDFDGIESKKIIYDSSKVEFFPDQKDIAAYREIPFSMGNRVWGIEFSLSNYDAFSNQPWVAWGVLAGGLLFTALLGAFLFVVAGSDARSQELITIRTRELQESRDRFQLAVTGSNDGLWDWNLISNDIYISPRYKEMIGYEDHEFENSMAQITSHIHPQDVDKVLGAASAHIEKRLPFQVEFRFKTKSGDYKWILTRGQALWSASGEPIRMVGFHTDISERKEIEKMKTQFFDMISHELRTPLTPIHQFTTILQDGLAGEMNEKQKEFLAIILKNTNQLKNIIADLVDVSRISTGKLAIHKESMLLGDLGSKIVQSFSQTAKAKGVRLVDDTQKNLPAMWADPVRFEQVLRNLIDNAIKFTPQDGQVTVTTTYPWEGSSGMVCFSVKDTGCGIPGKDKNKVFDRLYQVADQLSSSRKGLGLGLHICKEIVQQHNGQIWVDSEEGKGSVFNFTLPVFSFEKLLQPIIEKTNALPESLGLVFVNVTYSAKISEGMKRDTIVELESYLKRCILPHDVIMSGRIFPNQKAAFYVVVLADEPGLKIVSGRIQAQWLAKSKTRTEEAGIHVSYRMLPLPPLEQREQISADERVKMISTSLSRMINGEV